MANLGAPIAFEAQSVNDNSTGMVRVAAQYTKALSAVGEPASGDLEIFDGPGGGKVGTGAVMNPGDILAVSAGGAIWTGIVFSGDTTPDGWAGWAKNDKAPAPDADPYCLVAEIGDGAWFQVGSVGSHTAAANEQGPVTFAENDDNPLNGDPDKKWSVHWAITRAGAGAAGVFI